jgi:hypothetical protein
MAQRSRAPRAGAALARGTGRAILVLRCHSHINPPPSTATCSPNCSTSRCGSSVATSSIPNGNLLLRFGFAGRPPVEVSGTSRYTIATPAGVAHAVGVGRRLARCGSARAADAPTRPRTAADLRLSPLDAVWAHTAIPDTPRAADATARGSAPCWPALPAGSASTSAGCVRRVANRGARSARLAAASCAAQAGGGGRSLRAELAAGGGDRPRGVADSCSVADAHGGGATGRAVQQHPLGKL